ncbi:MarR family transcriptional regulator [Novosphingobium umbonatum]|uniref:MarR family transcriptional regulator n=1 Tax=Novosphingobium umbonatum TaxID=1908524 RepID=A0A437N2I4_9SPHN|nr:MarR family transcriptional regulator [Novosphingobium umbonatum]
MGKAGRAAGRFEVVMDNPFLNFPGYLLRRAASARLAQLAQYLEPLGVGVSEASILVLIGHNPGISQAECGRMLSIQRPNLNPVIHRFINRGLLVTTKGVGRVQCLRLSEEGSALVAQIEAVFAAQEERIYAAVPEHLRDDLVPVLRALWCP